MVVDKDASETLRPWGFTLDLYHCLLSVLKTFFIEGLRRWAHHRDIVEETYLYRCGSRISKVGVLWNAFAQEGRCYGGG